MILAERHDVPVVQMNMLFGGGFASDNGGKLGTASFSMGMLDEGAGDLDALAFGNRAESLGANVGASASLDGGGAYLSALKEKIEPSLALYAQMLRQPRFDQKEIDRVKAQWIAGIAQEKARPNGAALRVHAAAAVRRRPSVCDSVQRHRHRELDRLADRATTWSPTTTSTCARKTRRWSSSATPRSRNSRPSSRKPSPAGRASVMRSTAATVADVALPAKPRVFLIDQPGAIQANIYVGQLMPSTKDAGATRLEIANAVLGGEFSSRLNMNLREDKHWAYGSYSFLQNAIGERPWLSFAAVQIDKTAESLKEMSREINDYASGKTPATPAEVSKIQATEIRGLPGSFETANAVMGSLAGNVRYDRPDDYVTRRATEIKALTPAQVADAAKAIDPNALTWVVVGDLSKIEQPVRALNLGEVSVVDADGKPVAAK